MAEDVEQAYAAIYTGGALQAVGVYAVRFKETPVPDPPRADALPRGHVRLVRDRTVVVVSGDGGPCSESVGAYVREVTAR